MIADYQCEASAGAAGGSQPLNINGPARTAKIVGTLVLHYERGILGVTRLQNRNIGRKLTGFDFVAERYAFAVQYKGAPSCNVAVA